MNALLSDAIEEDVALNTTAAFSPHETRELIVTPAGPLTIHRPSAQTSKGEIILLPGWSGPRSGPADILVFVATKLAENGWTAVRLDLPGRGDASSNDPIDLDAMIAATARQFATSKPTGRRVLLGICSGGNVALGAAPLKACADCDAVIAISTFPFQPARTKSFDRLRRWKNIKRYAAKALSLSTWLRLIKGDINVDRVKKNVASTEKPVEGRNLKDSARDIEQELLKWKGTALFVWGGGDEEAPPARAHYEKLHASGLGTRAKFHTVAGANHNFYGKGWREELMGGVMEFLKR